MAHSLSDTDPLKQYLLQVINNLKIKLVELLEIHKGVGDLSYNNILIKDFSIIPNELVNVSGVYVLYHKENNYFYIGSASSLSTRFFSADAPCFASKHRIHTTYLKFF
jgi:hypothetical protein